MEKGKQAIGEAIGAANGRKTPPPTDNILREKTLLQIFKEAMEQLPRELEDALKELPRSKQHGKTNFSINETTQGGREMGNTTHAAYNQKVQRKTGVMRDTGTEAKEKVGQFQRAERAFKPSTTNGAHLNGGWQQVISKRNKKLRDKTSQQAPKSFSTQVHPEFTKAIRERRCFRCLATGHQRAQCREPPKCFKCHKSGHYSTSCKSLIKPPNLKAEPNKQRVEYKKRNTHQTFADCFKKKPQMELIEEFWNERPDEEDVYLSSTHVLRPTNEYLLSSAYVTIERGQQSAELPWQIKQTLVRAHGGRIDQYQLFKLDDTEYLLVCVNEQTLTAVIQRAPYEIQPAGVRIKLTKWTRTSGMSFTPNAYEAWIKLIGLPYQLWNDEEIRKVVARVGNMRYAMPYGIHSGQFEHITIQMDTKHPSNIPKFLRVRIGDFSRRVRVQLLGWRVGHDGYFPPPVPPNQTRPSTIRYIPYQQVHRRRPSPRTDISEESGNSNGSVNGSQWATGVKATLAANANKEEKRSLNGNKPSKIRVGSKPVWKPKLRSKTKAISGNRAAAKQWIEVVKRSKPTLTTPKVTNLIFTFNPKEMGEILVLWGKEVISKITYQPYKELSRIRQVLGFPGYNILQGMKISLLQGTDMRIKSALMAQLCTPQQQLLESNQGSNGPQMHQQNQVNLDFGFGPQEEQNPADNGPQELGPQEQQLDLCLPELQFGPKELSFGPSQDGPQEQQVPLGLYFSEEEDIGPPPGFENGPLYMAIVANQNAEQVRRSPRLSEKNKGPYITAVDKARRLKENQEINTPVKAKQVKKHYNQADYTYLETLNPLTDTQAVLVVTTAGIGIDDKMEDQLRKLVTLEPPAQSQGNA